jgi:hypothetical protein
MPAPMQIKRIGRGSWIPWSATVYGTVLPLVSDIELELLIKDGAIARKKSSSLSECLSVPQDIRYIPNTHLTD